MIFSITLVSLVCVSVTLVLFKYLLNTMLHITPEIIERNISNVIIVIIILFLFSIGLIQLVNNYIFIIIYIFKNKLRKKYKIYNSSKYK
ncbi:MAG: hypothetical protein Q8S84_05880 [bacterium]|nr:hypothetical protein [bacterium]MDP3381009.1 hypothetical protein [bacterium]